MKTKWENIRHLPSYLRTNMMFYSLLGIIVMLFIVLIVSFIVNWPLGLVLLVVYLIIAGILYFTVEDVIEKTNKYITDLSYRVHKGEQEALIKMPIGMLLYNDEEDIQWVNPYFQKYFDTKEILGRNLKYVDPFLHQQVQLATSGQSTTIKWKKKQFQFVAQKDINMLYLIDITKYAQIEDKYREEQPVIGQIFIDNFDEISQSLNDRRKSNLNNFVTNQLTSWALHNNIYLKRFDDDRFVAFLNKKQLSKLEQNKFDIIDKIRETTAKQNYPLTLSMGFSYNDPHVNKVSEYDEIASYAQSNLDLALGRGGDQVVVRAENEEARFYGGKTNPMEKRTRVRSRMVSQALEDLMKESDQIFIMSHEYPDMDAIGSCLGIRRIARMNSKKAYIVVDPSQYSNDITKLMDEIRKDEEISSSLISRQQALEMATANSLVVLVDVHRPSITVEPKLLENTNRIVIIDHHRRGQEFPKNPVLVYIEPYASSTGELITELFEYQSNDEETIRKIEATAILGGIIVDTRNFTLRTGSRTFDAASYLKSCGADTILIQRLLKENIDSYLIRSHLLASLEQLDDNIGIVHGEEDKVYKTVVAAQTADMMLSMEGIDASFVVTKREDGRVGISARSLGNKNVQRVMERLGGGGHLSNAATQLNVTSVAEALAQLKEVLTSMDMKL